MNTIEKADIIERFRGLTAEDMNYRARMGTVNKADLDAWAEAQNDYTVSIKWYVAEYTAPQGSIVVKVPELRSRSID